MQTNVIRMKDLKVCESMNDVARELVNRSFAVYELDPPTADLVGLAWRQASAVLAEETPPNTWTKIIDGHLHGFNVPSKAKRLFRAYSVHEDQPWPNEVFRVASQKLSQELHSILTDCLASIRLGKYVDEESQSLVDPGDERQRKRARKGLSSQFTRANGDAYPISKAGCPLDYFLYHNRKQSATNCSQHIDRGFLIVVCLTDVPGLEVFDRTSQTWLCPEVSIHNQSLYKEKLEHPTSKYVCIMTGDALSRCSDGCLSPCLHRVRDNLKRARLSISYEIRHAVPATYEQTAKRR